jgi:drug/metabolite transporter (DMT)-like permease
VLIVIFILNRAVSANSIWGVFFGILGVIATSLSAEINLDNLRENIFSVILVLFATASYAAASIYINEKCKNIQALDLACGSVFFAALFLLPSVFFVDFTVIDLRIGSSLLGLGLLCTGIAYLFYFKLAAQESPRFAVSVFLLIPVFGAILGVLFMDEAFTLNKIIGCVMILISIKFILNLSLKSFLKEKFVIEARKNLEELPK